MTNTHLYRQHLETLDRYLADALERAAQKGLKLDGVVFHAGRSAYYHQDDQEIPFHSLPHFLRWVPLPGPEHVVLARPGKKPVVVWVAPKDYWYEATSLTPSYWQEAVDLHEVAGFSEISGILGSLPKTAFVGQSSVAAEQLGISRERVEPEPLMRPLDWYRAYKTPHEVALLEIACQRAAEGHRVARKAFEAGANERQIHWAFLEASGMLENELPFETIVALDEKSATLHYQKKRMEIPTPKSVFIMDAGAVFDGYAADITRTWVRDGAHPVFRELLNGVDRYQRDLVDSVSPGRPFVELHIEAHRRTAHLLAETGISRGSQDETFASGMTGTFLPHGLGHHLGLQVHDIAGRQANADGGLVPPPPEYPALRNTRLLEPGHFVTIEPGIYFIPLLLEQLKATPAGNLVNWALVEELIPLGGIRIEDDVLCTESAPRDLTRGLIPGPRGV